MKFGDYYVFMDFDYSQIEMRVLAEFSNCKALIEIFNSGEDIHSQIGYEATRGKWSVELIKKNKKIRGLVKNVQFGMVYGKDKKGLPSYVRIRLISEGLSVEETNEITDDMIFEFYDSYFERFHEVRDQINKFRKEADETGYVKTMLGFRRVIEQHGGTRESYWGNQAINCVDYETECLTQRGWLTGKYIHPGDIVLTYSAPRQQLEWQSVIDVKNYPDYEGPVHTFTSKSFNAKSTPNHRWPIFVGGRGKAKQVDEKFTEELSNWESLPKVAPYLGPAYSRYSDDWIRLVGWVLTDGSYSRRLGKDKRLGAIDQEFTAIDQKGQGWANQGVFVCQTKKKNVKIIDHLFRRLHKSMSMPYRTRLIKNRKTNEEVFWSFSGQYGRWFKGMFPDRELTLEFLVQLPVHQLRILLETMLLGDGFVCRTKSGIDAYQVLVYLTGSSSSVSFRDFSSYEPTKQQIKKWSRKMGNVPKRSGIWVGKIHKRKKISMGWVDKKIENTKCGMWCPVVPNSFFVARREGKTFITGNSPIQGTAHNYMLVGMALLNVKPQTYKVLRKNLLMEIHDDFVYKIMLKNMQKAYEKARYLMQTDVPNYVYKWFGIKLKIPLIAECDAGFRRGVLVDYKGEDPMEFLETWRKKNKEVEKELHTTLKSLS